MTRQEHQNKHQLTLWWYSSLCPMNIALLTIPWWVSSAPFGLPVVPCNNDHIQFSFTDFCRTQIAHTLTADIPCAMWYRDLKIPHVAAGCTREYFNMSVLPRSADHPRVLWYDPQLKWRENDYDRYDAVCQTSNGHRLIKHKQMPNRLLYTVTAMTAI